MTILEKLRKEGKDRIIYQFISMYDNDSPLNMEIGDQTPLKDVVDILNLLIFKKEYIKQEQNHQPPKVIHDASCEWCGGTLIGDYANNQCLSCGRETEFK